LAKLSGVFGRKHIQCSSCQQELFIFERNMLSFQILSIAKLELNFAAHSTEKLQSDELLSMGAGNEAKLIHKQAITSCHGCVCIYKP